MFKQSWANGWKDAADGIIEAPVVSSFTSVGYAARKRIDQWTDLGSYDLDGQVIVITGATSGLGKSAAKTFQRLGATVVVWGRNPEKTERVARELGPNVDHVVGDMSELADVRAGAQTLLDRYPTIDVLIHNAGALSDQRRENSEGVEVTFASQVLGPFLLTSLLLDRLISSAPARILTMSSGGMYSEPLKVKSVEMNEESYNGTKAYARAKRAQVTLNEMWAKKLEGTGVVSHATHPGWADTPGVEEALPTFRKIVGPFLRTPEQGADTLVWLAADNEALESNGKFWLDRRARSIHKMSTTRKSDSPDQRQMLWDLCEERTS